MGVQKAILTRDPSYYGAGTVIGADGNPKQIQGGTGTLALGVPGNIFDASPARIHTALVPAGGADIGTFVAGEGVIVNPREYALKGVAGAPLAPSLTLTGGMTASFMTFGHVVVYLKNAATILATSGGMDGSIIVGKPADWVKSATVSYKAGDLVTYTDGKVYEAKVDVAANQDWDTTTNFAEYTGDDLCVLEVNGLN
jgi:hypothetical protein